MVKTRLIAILRRRNSTDADRWICASVKCNKLKVKQIVDQRVNCWEMNLTCYRPIPNWFYMCFSKCMNEWSESRINGWQNVMKLYIRIFLYYILSLNALCNTNDDNWGFYFKMPHYWKTTAKTYCFERHVTVNYLDKMIYI